MNEKLELKKSAALAEETNLEQRITRFTDLIKCIKDEVLVLQQEKAEIIEKREKNQLEKTNLDGNEKILIADIEEFAKKLKKKKEELNSIKAESDQLIKTDKQLKKNEEAQNNLIVTLDNELKLANDNLNVTIYRNECREFLCKPISVKDYISVLEQEIQRLKANDFQNRSPDVYSTSKTLSAPNPTPQKAHASSTPGYYTNGQSTCYKPPLPPMAIKSLVVGHLVNEDAVNFLLKEIIKVEIKNYSAASARWLMKKRTLKTNETESMLAKPNILIPLNTQRGKHWGLLHVNEGNKSMHWYDSLHFKGDAEMRQVESELNYIKFANGMPIFTYLKENMRDIPFQEDDNSCGVYTLFFAKHIVRKQSMNFDQDKINIFRNHIVYKLLKGREPDCFKQASCKVEGCKVNGKDFLPFLDSEIRKIENRWKDHNDDVEILSPKKTKESPQTEFRFPTIPDPK